MRFPFELNGGKEFDCVGFGLNAVDYLIVAPNYPAFDTKTRFIEFTQAAGGQTATAMVGLRRLELRTAYAGRFGSDREGEYGLQTLRDEKVNAEFAEVVEGAQTQTAFIIIDAGTGERTILWDRDERLSYTEEDAPNGLGERGRVLHMDAHDPAACASVARAAQAAGAIISVDVDNIYDRLPELLPLTDVLISSSEFPARLTGIADERTALTEIKARYGCPVVGMTCGARGAMLLCEGIFLESSAFYVPGGCRDTTGAGDAFHAGFLYGLLPDETIEESLRFGCAVAALKCRALGARTTLPNRAELKDFLQSAESVI